MSHRPVNLYQRYHAHVYFDAASYQQARQFYETAGRRFDLRVGRFHRQPVGPHTEWSCQIKFDHKQFDQIIPWLEQNRNGLSLLVHGDTGDNIPDHTDHAAWLGEEVALDLSKLREV